MFSYIISIAYIMVCMRYMHKDYMKELLLLNSWVQEAHLFWLKANIDMQWE